MTWVSELREDLLNFSDLYQMCVGDRVILLSLPKVFSQIDCSVRNVIWKNDTPYFIDLDSFGDVSPVSNFINTLFLWIFYYNFDSHTFDYKSLVNAFAKGYKCNELNGIEKLVIPPWNIVINAFIASHIAEFYNKFSNLIKMKEMANTIALTVMRERINKVYQTKSDVENCLYEVFGEQRHSYNAFLPVFSNRLSYDIKRYVSKYNEVYKANEAIDAEKTVLAAEIENFKIKYNNLSKECEILNTTNEKLRGEASKNLELSSEIDSLKSEINSLLNSNSWKITKSLRYLKKLFVK